MAQKGNVVYLSKPLYGFSVQAPNGVTYRKIMDIGIVFINGLVVGITEAFGMLFLHLCKHLN
ncbi:hypothetical protein AVI51_15570 (plasmid) [Piscirickettsia salmonis]|nr:hypothetical protein AVI48_00625 [Piscirickettsia salmonis]APS43146.1 hypothetical protein AVI48_01265 [Piscirickettsia salmonis]APS44263.1 hypothetical protein AVI48_07735 [Piscirickettsia salmonis]APS44275.1 hypothetical protein AVI48_07825 [Piscirickettsia salmonis]APS44376.1 hypothetical protein AVI48_08370 [Piscirickettsia salmonis]